MVGSTLIIDCLSHPDTASSRMSAVLEVAKVGDMSRIQAELARGANIDFKDEVKF